MNKQIEEILNRAFENCWIDKRANIAHIHRDRIEVLKEELSNLITKSNKEAVGGYEQRLQRAFEEERIEGHMPLGSEDIEYIVRVVSENILNEGLVSFSEAGDETLRNPVWEQPTHLIMCKEQPNPLKIKLDMRFKCNKEFVALGNSASVLKFEKDLTQKESDEEKRK